MRAPEDEHHYAHLAARLLASGTDDAEAAGPNALPDRIAAVKGIERALRARRRLRITPWFGAGIVAAAAAFLLVAGWRAQRVEGPGPSASLVAPGQGETVAHTVAVAAVDGTGASAAAGDRIAPGAWVRGPDSGALVLAIDTGTRLRVAAAAEVHVAELGTSQRFDLRRGKLAADVAKLHPGERFLVVTPDVEVEVKGTRFEVTVDPSPVPCAPSIKTRVAVEEGVVAVRRGGEEIRIAAGATWPTCTAPPSPAPPPTPVRNHRARAESAEPPPPTAVPPIDPSTLAEQNDLFAMALAARRRGDLGEAIRRLDKLISRYPSSPLVESARAERARLIAAGGGSASAE